MYKISTAEKKNVIETEKWKNVNGEVITHITGWRWGSWTSSSKPNLEDYDEEVGCDPYELSYDMDLESLDDGCWEEWELLRSLSSKIFGAKNGPRPRRRGTLKNVVLKLGSRDRSK